MKPTYIKDIQAYIDAVPYGTINLQVERVNRKTVEIITEGEETLRYTDNEEAVSDLNQIVQNLISTGYSGQALIGLEYKDGQIRLLSIHDKKQTQYQG